MNYFTHLHTLIRSIRNPLMCSELYKTQEHANLGTVTEYKLFTIKTLKLRHVSTLS
jgi:hypothetical protein